MVNQEMKNLKSLDDIANLYNTDKGTAYTGPTRHGYAPFYDKFLSKWRNDPIRMLEIGICMESTGGGHSVYMWRDYFSKASIYTFDIVDMSTHPAITECDRCRFYCGNQSNREDLENMYSEYGNLEFDFILDDGSHQHSHQMISFACLFQKISSGGYYILEDISTPDVHVNVCCIRNDETYLMLEHFNQTGKIESIHILPEEKEYLENNIKSIEMFMDIQGQYKTAIITKK
jgi:hypothetical protein